MFKKILGNDHVKEYLSRTLQKNTFGQSLLFAGPDGIGKSLFATAVAQNLLGCDGPAEKHPDLHIYRPEGKIGMHSIESMRRFSEEVYMSPFQSPHKVFIIQEAHRMLPTSANALLKTFEEPAENAFVILISSSPAKLLPTVLSRCRTIYFHPLPQASVASYLVDNCGLGLEQAQSVAAKSFGSIGSALRQMREGHGFVNEKVLELLALGGFASYKRLSEAAKELADQIDKSKEEIETELRAMRLSGGYEMSAAMKQAIEKEVEGAVTLYVQEQMKSVFDLVLGWYRDIELVRAGGRRELLYNADSYEALSQACKGRNKHTLESVQKIVKEVLLTLERSTSLNICFESLFLKLDLLAI
jgi:DNA polymerase-3 subunit delta'